jgi:hypothetical protein
MTGTFVQSQTFTITNARYLASKVRTDLKRIQQFYGSPSDSLIDFFESEMAALLNAGYLEKVSYGFKKNGMFIEPTVQYTAAQLAAQLTNDRPGGIPAYANITGSTFHSFLEYSRAWSHLTRQDRDAFEGQLSYQRTDGVAPSTSGYFDSDRSYTSGGTTLARQSLKAWS